MCVEAHGFEEEVFPQLPSAENPNPDSAKCLSLEKLNDEAETSTLGGCASKLETQSTDDGSAQCDLKEEKPIEESCLHLREPVILQGKRLDFGFMPGNRLELSRCSFLLVAFVFADGVTYTGEWRGNMREGEGTLDRLDGSRYTGQFKNNRAHVRELSNRFKKFSCCFKNMI